MWVNKSSYEAMKRMAENNEHDANMFRNLLYSLQHNEAKIVLHTNFALMGRSTYDELVCKIENEKNKLAETTAELEWYKNKYREAKFEKLNKDELEEKENKK